MLAYGTSNDNEAIHSLI